MTQSLSPAQLEAMRRTAEFRPLMQEVGDRLWQLAEVGLSEYRSAAYLIGLLRNNGFAVDAGICGFPTGFVAQFCNGEGPVMALLCEYDALPGMSSVQQGASGHGCGHNLYGAAAVSCALLLRDVMKKHGVHGTVRVYGTPGEENFAGKAYYVNHGLFNDVDCSVGFHACDENKVNYTVAAATVVQSYTFHGMPAHAGDCPWLGRSALDAVEIMNVACNYLREHVRTDVRIQYIITKGGDAPNTVPDLAASRYILRSASVPYLEEVCKRVDDCAHAAALATGCTVEIERLDKTYNTVLLREYAELAQQYLELAGPPRFSQQELAEASQYGSGCGLHTVISPLPFVEGYQGGATDEGDVSWVVPHVSVYTANIAQGTAFHSLPATCQMNLPAAYTAMVTQVKAVSAMLLELLQNPTRVAQLREAHAKKMGSLRYPQNPDYMLPAKYNPNCAGVLVEGNRITADFSQIILLPPDRAGTLCFVHIANAVSDDADSVLAGELTTSGTVDSAVPLKPGDSLQIIFQAADGTAQLVGYYNL